ncbi:MAG: hypothetical protein R3B96_11335 [Pirellulaceae bacterium]
MLPYIIGLFIVIGLILIAFYVVKLRAMPSVHMFGALRDAVLELQERAAADIFPEPESDEDEPFDPDRMDALCLRVEETIRLIYTIEELDGGLLHVMSSQLVSRRPEKYQVHCMVIALMTVGERLKQAEIDMKDVGVDIERAPTGTHYVRILLTREQHDLMMAVQPEGIARRMK